MTPNRSHSDPNGSVSNKIRGGEPYFYIPKYISLLTHFLR